MPPLLKQRQNSAKLGLVTNKGNQVIGAEIDSSAVQNLFYKNSVQFRCSPQVKAPYAPCYSGQFDQIHSVLFLPKELCIQSSEPFLPKG